MPAFRIASASRRVPASPLALRRAWRRRRRRRAAEPRRDTVENSTLDAPLFYQLLLGEIELRDGQAGTAYQLMLDAARRTKDEQLFRRATDIALQARAGDQALVGRASPGARRCPSRSTRCATRSSCWSRSTASPTPRSRSARCCAQTPRPALPALIDALPRFLARAADRNAAAALIERVLQPYADAPDTAGAGAASPSAAPGSPPATRPRRSRSRSARSEPTRAPKAPALLALDLLPAHAGRRGDRQAPARGDARPARRVRLLYVRTLATSQRSPSAAAASTSLTQSEPNLAPPWLTLGALELELKQPKRGRRRRCSNYVRLVEGGAAVDFGAAASAPARRRRRRRRHAAEREHGADAGLAAARAGRRAAAGLRRRRALAGARSTTRSARSRCSRGARRCWRARAR